MKISAPKTKTLPKLIAITGQEASGKDSYGDYLASKGYMHVAAGDILRSRARNQGHIDPISRSILSKMGDELKREFGPSPITESTIARYKNEQKQFPAGLVISGLRRVGELNAFKNYGAVSIWIVADDNRRLANQHLRARSDEQTDEEFLATSRREYFGDTQGGREGVNLQVIEAMADCKVNNDGSLEDLYSNADEALARFVRV